MATKNIVSRKRREKLEEERTPNHEGEEQSDEETDSDSDSAAAPSVPPKKPKFIKPLEPEPVENGSACSSPSASDFIIMPVPKPSGDKKKKKKMKKEQASASKLSSASKLFGNDDVITLLERLACFWVNGKNNKWAEFHLFVKDDLRHRFTKIQVSEKIRSLKKKFFTISERARANGGNLDLSDPHELVVFELSKALWGDEISIAPEEKGRIAENNVGKEADEITREGKVVTEIDEGSKNVKKRKQVCENGEGSKSTKKRKQRGEHGEVSKKIRKSEHGFRELFEEEEEGNLRDAAITIMSIRNQVCENGVGNDKTRKGEQMNELDDKELSKEGTQVDELEDKELPKEGIQLNEHDEAAKIPSKRKRGDEHGERKRKKKKRKAKERDEANKTARGQKEVDEHVGKKESLSKEVNQHGGNEELMSEGKQADEYEEQNVTTRKQKQADSYEVKKDLAKQGKQVDGHHEEENIPANQKQTKISAEHFQSLYPLLSASFDIYGYPMFTKEICLMIGQEAAEELEEKWREINIEAHHLELKRLDLMKRDSRARLQGKCLFS